jgi:hypothetical protein
MARDRRRGSSSSNVRTPTGIRQMGVATARRAVPAVLVGLALLMPGRVAHAQGGVPTPGLVTCTSFYQRFAVVLVREGFVSYAKGTEGCSPPVSFESLLPAERQEIGSPFNTIPPGSTFSGPVTVPPTGQVLNLISGPPPGVFFTSGPADTGVQPPSTVGQNVFVQQTQGPAPQATPTSQ